MHLHYLDFDFSGDTHGHGSFDAMASVAPPQLPKLQEEVLRVLDWAERHFGPAAALDEGGEWDFELQGSSEVATPLAVRYVPGAARLDLQPGTPGPARVTLTLTLSGSEAFCAALRDAFSIG
jgi:hypothetical protein